MLPQPVSPSAHQCVVIVSFQVPHSLDPLLKGRARSNLSAALALPGPKERALISMEMY